MSAPLRVLIVTQEDPFYVGEFFRSFLSLVADRHELVDLRGVMIQPALGSAGAMELARRIWALYGAFGFVRMAARYAGAKLAGSGIVAACQEHRVPLIEREPAFSLDSRTGEDRMDRPARPNNVNSRDFLDWATAERLDLIVSVSASQIFGPAVLGLPRLGCINLHNAPLPRYRGMLPNFWQMYHGESESVLTIHTMVKDLDAGMALLRHPTRIEPGMSLEELMTLTKRNSARALVSVLEDLAAGSAEAVPMTGDTSMFTWPTRAEAREFRRRGNRVW